MVAADYRDPRGSCGAECASMRFFASRSLREGPRRCFGKVLEAVVLAVELDFGRVVHSIHSQASRNTRHDRSLTRESLGLGMAAIALSSLGAKVAWLATNGSVFKVARFIVFWAAVIGRAAQGGSVRQCHNAVSIDGAGVCQQLQRAAGEIDRWVVTPIASLW